MRSRITLYLLLLLAIVNISTASILVRLSGVHGFVAATWRLIISSILTLLLIGVSRERVSIPGVADLFWMAISGFALAMHFGLWMMSLHYINVAPSVTIVDSYPALLAAAGVVFFGEKPRKLQVIGAVAAMLGVSGLAFYSKDRALAPAGGNPIIGSLLAFLGMIAVAIYFIIGKSMRRKYSTLMYTGVVYSIASIISIIVTILIGQPLIGYSARTMTYLVLLGILPMLGGHTVINYALARLSLLSATIPVLGEPVGAGLLAWALLGEPLLPGEVALMGITLAGIALVLAFEPQQDGGPGGI
ncbi:MAG: DMT family transporter [Desulfurococcales archaeon]|nr:DMT family transporter [Desulfurococcales archaeon]